MCINKVQNYFWGNYIQFFGVLRYLVTKWATLHMWGQVWKMEKPKIQRNMKKIRKSLCNRRERKERKKSEIYVWKAKI